MTNVETRMKKLRVQANERAAGRCPSRAGFFPRFYLIRNSGLVIRHLLSFLTLILLTSCSPNSRPPALTELKAYPPDVALSSKAVQRIVVQATYADGTTRDVTAEARFQLLDPRLARVALVSPPATAQAREGKAETAHAPHSFSLSPITDGKTDLMIRFASRRLMVPVVITNASAHPPLSFKLDVMPVFMKAGCNAGSCHGSARGKDGFRLSLFGFDPEGDYYRLTREQIGRRINLAIPEESLIVQKGLGAVQHTGGVRFGTNSDLCQRLVSWLNAGAPKDRPDIPKLAAIEIFPKSAVLEGANTIQRFIVRASYSNGAVRDVTPLAVFLSNNEITARVTEDGVVTAGQRGESFIQARFGEFNVGAQVIVIPRDLPYDWPNVIRGMRVLGRMTSTLRFTGMLNGFASSHRKLSMMPRSFAGPSLTSPALFPPRKTCATSTANRQTPQRVCPQAANRSWQGPGKPSRRVLMLRFSPGVSGSWINCWPARNSPIFG